MLLSISCVYYSYCCCCRFECAVLVNAVAVSAVAESPCSQVVNDAAVAAGVAVAAATVAAVAAFAAVAIAVAAFAAVALTVT